MNETKTQHTPGPWTIGKGDEEGEFAISANTWHTLAQVWDNPAMPDQGEANARLIAAAPKLLDAARKVSALVQRVLAATRGHSLPDDLDSALGDLDWLADKDLSAAIAAATGEEG